MMELVYLWVEDYKNIKKQGFNFSPRFHCEYNEERNELIINENNDYIPDFFGKNINITAIVGKNGSGKSSILKAIRENKGIGFKIFYNKRKEIFHIESNKIKPICNCSFDSSLINVYYPLFDYSLSYDKFISYSDNSTIERYSTYPNKINGKFDFIKELERNQKNIINNYFTLKEKNQLEKFSEFFELKEIFVSFYVSNFNKIKNNKNIFAEYRKFISKLENSQNILDAINIIKNNLYLFKYSRNNKDNDISDIDFDEELEFIDKYNSDFNDIDDICHPFNITCDNNNYSIWGNSDSLKKLIDKNLISKIEYEIDTIEIGPEILNNKQYLLSKFNVNDLTLNDMKIIFQSFSSDYFIIELIDTENKKLNDLSFGQQQLIFILNQLFFLKEKKYDTAELEENSYSINVPVEYVVLLDEIDIGFHPDWQKRTIQYIIDFLSLIPDKNFHLIFTTHSPFLLSDIPKENIIFLNDKSSIKQTFGANIHTLLSDSFFMEDGLMGEFAKSKINEIINFHKKVEAESKKEKNNLTPLKTKYKKLKTKFWQIQSIIGEEYLKQVVKNHLRDIENILLGFDEAKKEEIKRLRAEADRLENM